MRDRLSESVWHHISCPATLWRIEETVANTQRYRATLAFLERLARLIGTEYWQNIYEEAKYEEEHNLNIITEVEGVPIYKSSNYSASFQLPYFSEHNTHYGDCGDVTVMSVAIAKALGIPALHIHYDLVDDNYQEVLHSFPAYYSSAEQRYRGFRNGYNLVWDWAKSGRTGLRVHYFYDRPIYEWFSQFYYRALPGTNIWTSSNQETAIVSLEEWQFLNSGGFSQP